MSHQKDSAGHDTGPGGDQVRSVGGGRFEPRPLPPLPSALPDSPFPSTLPEIVEDDIPQPALAQDPAEDAAEDPAGDPAETFLDEPMPLVELADDHDVERRDPVHDLGLALEDTTRPVDEEQIETAGEYSPGAQESAIATITGDELDDAAPASGDLAASHDEVDLGAFDAIQTLTETVVPDEAQPRRLTGLRAGALSAAAVVVCAGLVLAMTWPGGADKSTGGDVAIDAPTSAGATPVGQVGETTPSPSGEPSRTPSHKPSRKPSKKPTRKPTQRPTQSPTQGATEEPEHTPSRPRAPKPTHTPTPSRDPKPTRAPEPKPTQTPKPTPKPDPKPDPGGTRLQASVRGAGSAQTITLTVTANTDAASVSITAAIAGPERKTVSGSIRGSGTWSNTVALAPGTYRVSVTVSIPGGLVVRPSPLTLTVREA